MPRPNGPAKPKPKLAPLNANMVATVADRRDVMFHKWPLRYDQRFAEMAVKCVRFLGATEREVALCIGIPDWKLKTWKKDHPEFAEALREARAEVDAEVATRLFQRAMGYEHKSEKIFMARGQSGENEVIRAEYTEHYPPDTDAAKFWLKNRQPSLWREVSHREERSEAIITHMVVEARDRMVAQIDAIAERIEAEEGSRSG